MNALEILGQDFLGILNILRISLNLLRNPRTGGPGPGIEFLTPGITLCITLCTTLHTTHDALHDSPTLQSALNTTLYSALHLTHYNVRYTLHTTLHCLRYTLGYSLYYALHCTLHYARRRLRGSGAGTDKLGRQKSEGAGTYSMPGHPCMSNEIQ